MRPSGIYCILYYTKYTKLVCLKFVSKICVLIFTNNFYYLLTKSFLFQDVADLKLHLNMD